MGNIISSIARGINAVLMAIVNVSPPPSSLCLSFFTSHIPADLCRLAGHHDDRLGHRQRHPRHLVLLRQAHHLWQVRRTEEEREMGKE